MAGSGFDLSTFIARVDRLTLDRFEPLIRPDAHRESLPRVTLLRTDDLLSVQVRFVDLELEDLPEGKILRRSSAANVGHLCVLFGGQHLHERAFFQPTDGVSLANVSDTPRRPPDPDAGKTKPEDLIRPPVQTRIAGATRLVFQVTDQQIPYTIGGILAALGTLPLSVAPHAARSNLMFGARRSINDFLALDARVVDDSRISGMLHTSATTLRTAAVMQVRFGTSASAASLMAASEGSGTFGLGVHARRDLAAVIGEKNIPPLALPPVPRAPLDTETAIELPWRLQLSPHAGAGFAHADSPAVSADGRVELWHTRLGARLEDRVDEGSRDDRTVRAVWARDFDETPGFTFHQDGGSGADFPKAGQEQDVPNWRSPLNSRDRMMLVHETSNFHLAVPHGGVAFRPPSVNVDRLMLSSLGGWLASRFETEPPGDSPATIEEWVHRASLGRDHFVKVVYKGFLLPFLHSASLVKITERKVQDGIGYLFQRMFVVIRDPLRGYGATGRVFEGKQIDLSMPFSSVRMLTLSTPDIDPPIDLEPDPGTAAGVMFTPTVGTQQFRFRMLGIDLVGRMVEFDGPLVFAEFDHNQNQTAIDSTIAAYRKNVPTFTFRGQKVAFAASATADDTSVASQTMAFDVVSTPEIRLRPAPQVRMEPMLQVANVSIPAMSTLAGANGSVLVNYPDVYLAKQFAGNAAEVFLQLKNKAALNFTTQSDRSGGFVAPSLEVTALSRTLGPVGGTIKALTDGGDAFDLAKFFPTSAQLFGLAPLGELLPRGFGTGKLPRLMAQSFDAATMFTTNIERIIEIAGRLASAPEATAVAPQLQTIAGAATDLRAAIAAMANSADGVPMPAKTAAVAAAIDPVIGLIDPLPELGGLLRSDREALTATANRVLDLGKAAAVNALEIVAGGGVLPETVRARLDWTTRLLPWPADVPIFVPVGEGKLTLAVDVQAPTTPGGAASALVSCSISAFKLVLIGKPAFITLSFQKLEFSSVPGKKTDVNVVFDKGGGVEFGGPLSFVKTLQEIIPFDGFSDPPYLDVSAAGIKAGFDIAIPTIAMGVFALSNITFSAAFEVPFIGESIAVRFGFASRENPFRLQVSFFAGGGFFGIVITPKEVRQLEAAFEFGAAVSLNFGVASGSVSVMAGIYFCLKTQNGHTDAKLTGYFRARGEVDVLGLITASIEIYLELTYETATQKAVGRASISVEVSVCMLSFSVSISCEKKFAGSEGDPTFAEVMGLHPLAIAGTSRPWDDYCDAFAD